MKIYFVTTNKHKFNEVKNLLKNYPFELEQLSLSYEENHDLGMDEIARNSAKRLSDELNKAVVVDDTGLFFEAYDGFPGAFPKFVINTLGYKGIFKLLEGESRRAYFKTIVAFCEPGNDPVLFKGVMNGCFSDKVHNQHKDVMPYDRIFIPDGANETLSDMDLDGFCSFSQRSKAFRKLGEFLNHKLIKGC